MNKIINRHLNEIRMYKENIRLIYLNNCEITSDIRSNLLEINPNTQVFTDIQLCIDFIKTVWNEKCFLIISSELLRRIFKYIYSLPSIICIFIYDDKPQTNPLDMKYLKIIGQYTNQNDLLKSLQEKTQFLEKQTFIYSLFDERMKSTRDLSKDAASFLWYLILINILKEMPEDEPLHKDFLNKSSEYYRANHSELDKIKLFRHNYTSQKAIEWYINESFVYKLLNRALYTTNFEFLYALRFFILDLCLQIDEECNKMDKQGYLTVYHEQVMSIEEIEKLKDYIGCYIAINGFLLTSYNKDKLLSNFEKKFSIYENVLFEIQVDLSIETVTFADISPFTSMPHEKEILFNINSLFKIESIECSSANHLWNIKLIASDNGIKHIHEYLRSLQKEMDYPSRMILFGRLLWNELGDMSQAKHYFQTLLKSLPSDHDDISKIYSELANIYDQLEEYKLALENYRNALDIYENQSPNDAIHIGSSLNKIGVVHTHKGDLSEAMNYYRQSLAVYDIDCSRNEEHLHRTDTMVNIALIYRHNKDFDTALTYLNSIYTIRYDILPINHPLIADTIIQLGNIYHDQHDYQEALDYYQQALTIQEKYYVNNHLTIIKTIRKIALTYREKQDWSNALTYSNHALEMHQSLLKTKTHIDIALYYGDIGHIYEKMNNFDMSFDYYDQQFQIEEQYLCFNHPNLLIHFDKLINILKKKNQYEKAIGLCHEKLSILKDILGIEYENHPRMARILVLIATIYEDRNPREADQHYQQALEIFENNQSEDVSQICLSTMINFYWKCRMFDRALTCQMKLLNIRRSTLSSNHHEIGYTLRDLARLYRVMNKSNEALKYFNQSLTILKGKYGSEHKDVKNIQKEIIDLKDIMKSMSSNADEDYNNRRASNAHKAFFVINTDEQKSHSSFSFHTKQRSVSASSSTSAVCNLL